MNTQPLAVLIVGTGVLGTSMAIGLQSHGYHVYLDDIDAQSLQRAAKLSGGSIMNATITPDIVVVAVPAQSAAGLIVEKLQQFQNAYVTDIASAKAHIVASVKQAAPHDAPRFIPGHPMAGSEKTGPLAANGQMFHGANWVLCAKNKLVEGIVHALQAEVVYLDPEEHDTAVALVSHVPQLTASILAAQFEGQKPELVQIAGQGVRDMTRIADSDADLWRGIIAANAHAIAPIVQNMVAELGKVDLTDVSKPMKQGNRGKAMIPGKRGHEDAEYAHVHVVIHDAPGQMVKLLTSVADAGINLEDMRIEHAPKQKVGLVDLLVARAQVPRLHQHLQENKWEVM